MEKKQEYYMDVFIKTLEKIVEIFYNNAKLYVRMHCYICIFPEGTIQALKF
jgi:hypothetical protein